MADMAHAIFAHALHGKVELAWTIQDGGITKLEGARLFDLTDLDGLAAHAARVNVVPNRNVYISAGLRREDAPPNHRAKKDDVIAVAALKLDCDEAGCFAMAIDAACDAGIPPTHAFFTGRTPHLRGSLWWVLEEPDGDIARAETIERQMGRAVGADKSAWNADRVMRLTGSVAWPMKKGRILELTGAYATAVTRRPPYTLDELEHALPRLKLPGADPLLVAQSNASVIDLATARRTLDVPSMLEAASAPHEFHDNARDATANLIARGAPPQVVWDLLSGAVRMAGVNVPQRLSELRSMIASAANKYGREIIPANDRPLIGIDPQANPFITIDEMLNRPPPTYVVDGYLTDGALSVLWGASGAFKSFVAIDLTLSIAGGLEWHGKRTEKRPVIYVCAEGQYGFGVRALAWRQSRGDGADISQFHVLPVAVNFMEPANLRLLVDAVRRFIPSAVERPVIAIDTLARNFGDGNENDTKDMNRFVASANILQRDLGAHVLLIHHTGKDDSKGERGAYSLRGAVDTSLKLVRDGTSQRISLEHYKQKDGPEQEPMSLRMATIEAVHPTTGECLSTLVPVLDDGDDAPTPRAMARIGRNERIVLAALRNAHPLRHGQIHAQVGMDKGALNRALRSLIDKKLVKKDGEDYVPMSPDGDVSENVTETV